MINKSTAFDTEKALGQAFSPSATIKNMLPYRGWNSWEAKEIQGLFGVPDHLLVLWRSTNGQRRILRTVSFEIKKEKWRRALVQAYRYLAFSDYSFVVMDQAFVHRAIVGIEEFKRSNIGLLSVSREGSVEWHYIPKFRRPYSESSRRFLQYAIQEHLFDCPRPRGGPTVRWSVQ